MIDKIVEECKLKNPMGIKIGRLKKPTVKKLMGKLMGKKPLFYVDFESLNMFEKKIHLRVEISIYGF